jgi:hypothetical protein
MAQNPYQVLDTRLLLAGTGRNGILVATIG